MDSAVLFRQPEKIMSNETETWLAWIDGNKYDAVEFEAPVGGAFDVAEAGASALGVEVSEALNVERK
jgi:hypothetical protein